MTLRKCKFLCSNIQNDHFQHRDLGVQIDGFMALVAHTLVVGATGPVSGRKADVIAAANAAAEVVARTLKAGAKVLLDFFSLCIPMTVCNRSDSVVFFFCVFLHYF